MKISSFAISEIANLVVPLKNGRELVLMFNRYGFKDVYDESGLPDIGKKTNQRPSKREYLEKRLSELSGKQEMRFLLESLINETIVLADSFKAILKPEGFSLSQRENFYSLEGEIIDNRIPVVNQAYFETIQDQLLSEIEKARVSIIVVMAWFTNKILLEEIVKKHESGVDVKVVIYDDDINKRFGVDLSQIPFFKIKKSEKGGLMHNKFCVIDNQVVITGSYNWTNRAEFNNDENIVIQRDPNLATEYTLQYKRLIQSSNNN